VDPAAADAELAGALRRAGLDPPSPPADPGPGRCPVLEWAASGAMALTGRPDGPPLAPTGPVLARLGAAARLVAAAGGGEPPDPGALLAARARHRPLRRAGRRSAGGACALLASADGWVAVNLARPDDVETALAVLAPGVDGDPVDALAGAVTGVPASTVVDTLQLLGVPAAALTGRRVATPVAVLARGPSVGRRRRAPLVVDLSAMWAGPLCAHLLGRAGARVVTVEDPGRPDGARVGDPRLHAELHAGHPLAPVDLSGAPGRRALAELVASADVVVEGSRPRALDQLGVDPFAFVAGRPGRTWVSITGYGRAGPWANRVAFGDDAAVAGGLVAREDSGDPVFCADAVADPVSGLYAAAAALVSVAAGGGHLLSVAMADAAAFAGAGPGCAHRHRVAGDGDRWRVACGDEWADVVVPVPAGAAGRPRRTRGAA